MKTYQLHDRILCDLKCLLDGSFQPLTGFMNQEDYLSVLHSLRLSSGELWPLPIVCPIPSDDPPLLGEIVTLTDSFASPVAMMLVRDVYTPSLSLEQELALGTTDSNHPYVQFMCTFPTNPVYISGTLTALNPIQTYNFDEYRLTPEEVKEWKAEHNVSTLVGFQTRNPMHRCHYELTQYALRQTKEENAVLLLQPIVGITQATDVDYATRVRCYKHILSYYTPGQVKLCLLSLSMRMAGPREAMLHALVRKNYGCTHFIVGRDHAGPSTKTKDGNSFYGPYDAHDLLSRYASDLGIEILTSKMMCYVSTLDKYLPMDEVPDQHTKQIQHLSGTDLRHRLRNHQSIPNWFTFPEIAQELQRGPRQGVCYYIIGLPSAGKTTLANALRDKLLETETRPITILDGDVVRTHLSKGLSFSKEDRSTNVRRIGYVAMEIVKHGGIVICANIAPYEDDRQINRDLISSVGTYIEILMDTSLNVCETRDVKGLYRLARKGVIKNLTGIDDPFERPIHPDFIFDESTSIAECVRQVI